MNNKIKMYPAIFALCVICVQCTQYDEYKKYMPDGEKIYPQKVDAIKTYPGKNRVQLEWVLVDPKVTSCIVYYEQGGVQGSTTVAIDTRGNYENDTIRVIIPNLEETTYAFKIISYDDLGHASISVETEESVYGEMYERSLLNRALKNAMVDEIEGLQLEWYDAENTEVGLKIDYTDNSGENRTMMVSNTETTFTISDLKVGEPIYYSTVYRPVADAIDVFYSQTVRASYYANITPQVMRNTERPFLTGNQIVDNLGAPVADRFEALYWTANDEMRKNGNVNYGTRGGTLYIWTSSTALFPGVINGKLYQTVELEAGNYRFDAQLYEVTNIQAGNFVYVVAALGNDLPDLNNIEQSLGITPILNGINAPDKLSVEFTLSEKNFVSLGFFLNVSNAASTGMVHFNKVELWEQK